LRLVIARRWDQLGGRLSAIVNARSIAEVLALEFRFIWPRGLDPAVNEPAQLFDQAFLDGFEIQQSELDGRPRVYYRTLESTSAASLRAELEAAGDDAFLEVDEIFEVLGGAAERFKRCVWGTGQPTRDFLFVDDAARALILAAERTGRPFAVNVGGGAKHSIAELVDLIAALVGFGGEIVWDGERPDGQARRMLDVSLARELLGFEPEVAFEDGLRRTVAAYT
jgi:GDP-mannose 4,6 dehydratase